MKTQLPLFAPESSWRPPELSSLSAWGGAKRVCLDVETFDPNLKDTGPSVRTGGHLAGIGVGIEGGPSYYLPMRHAEGDNLDAEGVMRYITEQAKHFDGEIVGANLSYDLDWLWDAGVKFPNVKRYRDILIAEPLLDDNKFSYSLDSTAETWVGELKDKSLMEEAARAYGMTSKSDLGKFIHLLPARFVGLYGEQDVKLPLKVLQLQEQELEKQGLNEVWDLESDLLPVLVKMRQRGVAVDETRLMEVELRCLEERIDAAEEFSRLTGVKIGPEDDMQKGALVKGFRAIGMDIDPEMSIDKGFIKLHAKTVPAVAALEKLRKWNTLRKLSIEPTKNHLVNGRIHCTFNQLATDKDNGKGSKGARYGRLSCEHTNMQQQPARDEEIAPIWRRIYMPDGDGLWAANDYSQQEPRMLVHFAEQVYDLQRSDYPMQSANVAANEYRTNPETDNHQMMADLAGIDRKEAKILFLGLCYGMGQEKLCNDLGLPTKVITLQRGPRKGQKMVVAGSEAERIINRLHAKLPFLKQMENFCKEMATERGYIKTLSGRRCRFRLDDEGLNYWGTHKALNRLIQGSSADQTKRAMVLGDREGFALQLQVHDEIDLTVENPEEAHALAKVMRNCVELQVPSKVDVELGPSWGEAA